jgi:hypothetical protein
MEQPKRPVKSELFSGERWRSSFFYTIRIVLILCVPLAVWSYFNAKQNVNKIQVAKGGNLTINQQTKRAIIPFVEVGGEKTNSNKFGTYVRFGARMEF